MKLYVDLEDVILNISKPIEELKNQKSKGYESEILSIQSGLTSEFITGAISSLALLSVHYDVILVSDEVNVLAKNIRKVLADDLGVKIIFKNPKDINMGNSYYITNGKKDKATSGISLEFSEIYNWYSLVDTLITDKRKFNTKKSSLISWCGLKGMLLD